MKNIRDMAKDIMGYGDNSDIVEESRPHEMMCDGIKITATKVRLTSSANTFPRKWFLCESNEKPHQGDFIGTNPYVGQRRSARYWSAIGNQGPMCLMNL